MIDQSCLRNCRAIVMRRDDQNCVCAGSGRAIDFSDRAARALLAGADKKRECFRNDPPRGLDHLKIFVLIEIDSLAGRAEYNIARDTTVVPLLQIRGQPVKVDLLDGSEGRRDGQQQAAEIEWHNLW